MSSEHAVLELAALIRSGATTAQASKQFRIEDLSAFERQQFHLIWSVAKESGGQLAQALDRLAQVFEVQRRSLSELKIAFASPKATANLILLLPIAGIFLAELFGIAAIGTALSTPLGIIAIGLGLILLIAARLVSLRMLSRAKPSESDPGGFLDAVVIALNAGLSARAATTLAKRIYAQVFERQVGIDQLTILQDAIEISERSGIALSGILLARADAFRHKLWSRSRADLSRLGISLMIPLGLAALPAFVLLAVVPVGLGLFKT